MKKLIALLLAVVMVLSLVACTAETPDTPNTPANSDTPNTPAGNDAPVDDEPIVLTMWRSTTSQYYIDENSETFQRLHQVALEEGNVDLQIEYFDWGEEYQQKMMMHATDGSLPTGLWLMNGPADTFYTELIDGMGQAGYIYEWTDYAYDFENYPNLSGNVGKTFLDMSKSSDGKLYCIPSYLFDQYPHAAGGMSLRKDWLLELGMEYPTNEDELYEVIKAFTAYTDTPVSFNGWDNFTYWLNAWLGSSLWIQKGEGEWVNGLWDQPENLEAAIVFLNKLWNEGLLDKESFTQTGEQYLAKGANGDYGVTCWSYAYTGTVNDALYESPESDRYFVSIPTMSCFPGLSAENVNSCEFTAIPVYRTIAVRNAETEAIPGYMDKIAKAMDWIGSYEAGLMLLMGFEGSEWEYNADGKMVRTQAYIDASAANVAHQYNSGLCFWSELNTNTQAGVDLLRCINTKKSDLDSCDNVAGHQVGVATALNVIPGGEVAASNSGLISDAFQAMFIEAISAPSEAECRAVVAGWSDTLNSLGYQDLLAEMYNTCEQYGIDY